MSRIWNLDMILALPEFGGDYGWFYGIVNDDGQLRLCEIFPGTGYAFVLPRPWRLREWWMVLSDVWTATPSRVSAVFAERASASPADLRENT